MCYLFRFRNEKPPNRVAGRIDLPAPNTMNRIARILCLLVFPASVVFAQDKARAIVEKAIQAQVGETEVANIALHRMAARPRSLAIRASPGGRHR